MSDSTNREWRFYIDDMIGFAEKVMNYTEGMEQERFVSSGLNYDATAEVDRHARESFMSATDSCENL